MYLCWLKEHWPSSQAKLRIQNNTFYSRNAFETQDLFWNITQVIGNVHIKHQR